MKASSPVSAFLLLLGAILGASGCAHLGRQPALHGSRTYALAVSLPNGEQLTPEQWAFVKNTFEKSLDAQGGVLVGDITDAERILRVEFVPDPLDPTSGQATVLSVRTNPLYAYAPTRPAYSSLAFHGGISSHSSLFRYYDSYYGYQHDYIPAAYIPPVVTRPDPHNGGKPFNPDDCPPGMERPERSRVVHGDRTPRHGGYIHPGDGGSPRGTRVYARSAPDASGTATTRYARRESNASRSERTYARGSSGVSGRDRGYSRSSSNSSRSEPSYGSSGSSSSSSSSGPTYSSSSSSDSSAYSSSASSSSGSYTNDSGGGSRSESYIVEAK